MPAKPDGVKAATEFFRPHIPRFAKALTQHPVLFTRIHRAVQQGEVTIKQLRTIGAHFVSLPPEAQRNFHNVFARAAIFSKTAGAKGAVELLLAIVEKAKQAQPPRQHPKAAQPPAIISSPRPRETNTLPPGKRIVVKFSDLHPDTRVMINELKAWRKLRLKETGKGAAIGAGIGAATPIILNLLFNYLATKTGRPKGGFPTFVYLAAPAIGSGVLSLLNYKLFSPDVRQATRDVGSYIRAKSIDAAGKLKAEEVRKTHPFAFVNRKGDVVLLPNTAFQRALAKAQGTFLKHVLPARYRVKI